MPSIGLGFIGFGTIVLVQCAVTYMADAYASNAVGALAFLENLISGCLPLTAQRIYRRLGFQWASSTLAPVVFLLWKDSITRGRSKYMCNS